MRPLRANLQFRDLTLAECGKVIRRAQDWGEVHITELGPLTFTGDNQVTYRLDVSNLTPSQVYILSALLYNMQDDRDDHA